jgi:hypothetical protein
MLQDVSFPLECVCLGRLLYVVVWLPSKANRKRNYSCLFNDIFPATVSPATAGFETLQSIYDKHNIDVTAGISCATAIDDDDERLQAPTTPFNK